MAYVEGEFYVEKILGKRYNKDLNRREYHIKWQGYDDPSDNTWEPRQNLPAQMVADFEEKRRAKKANKRIANDGVEFVPAPEEKKIKKDHDLKKGSDVKKDRDIEKAHDVKKDRDVKKENAIKKAHDIKKANDIKKAHDIKKANDIKKAHDIKKANDIKKVDDIKKEDPAHADLRAMMLKIRPELASVPSGLEAERDPQSIACICR
jgi:hypothetical protein